MGDTQKPTFESESRKIYTGHLDAYQKDMYEAIENNRLDDLRELFENTTTSHSYSYFDWDTHPGPFVSIHFQIAARKGHFDILKYIIKTCNKCYQGCNIDRNTCGDAAACGHLNCLRFAYEFEGAPIEIETFYNAAEYGHVECLRYAFDKAYDVYDRNEDGKIMCAKAAKNGHINCLKLLREQEMHWDEQTCKSAVECALKYNQVECLEYAYKYGCPYSKEVLPIIITKIFITKWRAAIKNRSFSSIE